jgi:uncharacterized protein
MSKRKIICATAEFVQQAMQNDSAHDWWHVYRVWKLAKYIGAQESADQFIVEMAALLHDLEDWKFHPKTSRRTKSWLEQMQVQPKDRDHILAIITNISFQGAKTATTPLSIEGKIVQDADRLDAIGAIGIARTFAYGGFKKREIHNPNTAPKLSRTFAEYKKSGNTTINHFYEKLLLLKDRINTVTGKKIAKERHAFMQKFLKLFLREWDMDF